LNRQPILSPQFLYAQELLADGNFPQDVGSDGETLCKVLIAKGCCEASLYPYTAGEIEQPTQTQEENAQRYELGAYHGITDSITAVSCLSDPVPWPVLIGFYVFQSFESNEVAQTGVMPIPSQSEKLLGGHEVCGCGGYDIGDVPTLRPQGCPPAILVQNSWGADWGIGGFFWMPLQIFDQSSTDIKICHSGEPWK
jgi:C1A family cysteine protease